jgi:alginate O-acetyltransferase complex protein AlgI
MTLLHISVFIASAFIYRWLPAEAKRWALLMGSIVVIYWMQPFSSIYPLDFLLPTLTLLLGIGGWLLCGRAAQKGMEDPPRQKIAHVALVQEDWITLAVVTITVLALAVGGQSVRLLPSGGPPLNQVIAFGGVFAVLAALSTPLVSSHRNRAIWYILVIFTAVFFALKSEPIATLISTALRAAADRPLTLASAIDLRWLGFSYVAFRLIHTLRDYQAGKLPHLSLREYLAYLIFFPAYTAGPIDRAERFVKDYRAMPITDAPRAIEGSGRILAGLFKKFVIADSLALLALNSTLATQVTHGLDMWVLVYAYAFYLYFDFSGYSDIAIGIGRLYGINLPENFNLPYFKSNLTAFWQSWHITLSNWARFYVFTPLSRVLLGRKLPPMLALLIAHLSTMITIGLWHGVTLNFVIWGIWHAMGLFIHKLYSDRTREFYQALKTRPKAAKRLVYWVGVLLTFHYVVLGWVWFALPETSLSLEVFRRLFGG